MIRSDAELIHPGKDNEQVTLKDVLLNALAFEHPHGTPGYKTETAAEKYKRGKLCFDVEEAKETISLSAEEIVLIKELINQTYGAIVYKQAVDILEMEHNDAV